MAQINGSSSKNNYGFYAEVTEIIPSDYISGNYTNVKVDVYVKNNGTRFNSNSWTKRLSVNGSIAINQTGQNINTTTVGYNDACLLMSATVAVPHNADGSKTVAIEAYIEKSSYGTYDPGRCSLSGNVGLTKIPRYASSNQNLSSKTETSIVMNWSSDSTIDYIWYSKDNGSTWTAVDSVSATSGNYTISGLSANTPYNIKTRVRRKDSQLTTDSSTLAVTTYDYPHCTNSPDFTVGNSLTLTFYNPLKRSIAITIIGADGSTKTAGTTTGTAISPFNNDSWQDWFYSTIPSATEGIYQVQVKYGTVTKTRNNGNKYRLDLSKCTPTFTNFIYKDSNTIVTEITENDQVLVKGLSNLQVTIPSANKMLANKSATAKSYNATIASINKNENYATTDVNIAIGAINASGTQRLNVRAYDSRNNSTLVYKDITVYDYTKPVINATVKRLNDFEDETTLKVSGTYTKLTIANNNKNTVTNAQYRYRESNGEWGNWTSLSVTVNNGQFTCADVILSLENTKSFEIQIQVTDKLQQVSTDSKTVDVGKSIFFISSNMQACYIDGDLWIKNPNINDLVKALYDMKINGDFEIGEKKYTLNKLYDRSFKHYDMDNTSVKDFDGYVHSGIYYIGEEMTNGPLSGKVYGTLVVITSRYYNWTQADYSNWIWQLFFMGERIFMRKAENNSFSNWRETNSNYSENEEVIGTYLGDTLYRKVVKINKALTIGENLVPHQIKNLKHCAFVNGVSEANQTLPRFEGTTSITGATSIKAVNGTNIVVGVIGEEWSSRNWYFTIEYTKTKN